MLSNADDAIDRSSETEQLQQPQSRGVAFGVVELFANALELELTVLAICESALQALHQSGRRELHERVRKDAREQRQQQATEKQDLGPGAGGTGIEGAQAGEELARDRLGRERLHRKEWRRDEQQQERQRGAAAGGSARFVVVSGLFARTPFVRTCFVHQLVQLLGNGGIGSGKKHRPKARTIRLGFGSLQGLPVPTRLVLGPVTPSRC
jgi:hypothetical protein